MEENIPGTVLFGIWVVVMVVGWVCHRTVSKAQRRTRIEYIAASYTHRDREACVSVGSLPDWADYRRGIEEQLCLIRTRLDGMSALADVTDASGSKPFLFLRPAHKHLHALYDHAKHGIVDTGVMAVIEAMLRRVSGQARAGCIDIPDAKCRELERTLGDMRQLMEVIVVLAENRWLVKPSTRARR